MAFTPSLNLTLIGCPGINLTLLIEDNSGIAPSIPTGWNDTLFNKESYGQPYVTCSTINIKRNGIRITCPIDVLPQIKSYADSLSPYVLTTFAPVNFGGSTRIYDGDYEVIWEIIDSEGNNYTTTNTLTVSCGNPPPSKIYDLKLKLSTTEIDCKSLNINDVTGLYDYINNTTGWNDLATVYRNNGLPIVAKASLEIKKDGVELLGSPFNVLTTIQDATAENYVLYKIDNISDGIYEGILTVIDSDCNVYQAEFVKPVYCNVKCCVSKLAADTAKSLCDNCKSKSYNIFQKANVFLKALKLISCCLKEQEFTAILTKLKSLCYKTPCDCKCNN